MSLSTTIPWEILIEIFTKVPDAETALTAMRVCRATYRLLHPTQKKPMYQFWEKLRIQDGWPDPSIVGLSNYTFLLTVYNRGCNMCDRRPYIRSVNWGLNGLRLCPECMEQVTYSREQLRAGSDGSKVLAFYLSSATAKDRQSRYLRSQVDFMVPSIDRVLLEQRDILMNHAGITTVSPIHWSRIVDLLMESLQPIVFEKEQLIREFAQSVKSNKRQKSRWKGVDEGYVPPKLRPRNLKTR